MGRGDVILFVVVEEGDVIGCFALLDRGECGASARRKPFGNTAVDAGASVAAAAVNNTTSTPITYPATAAPTTAAAAPLCLRLLLVKIRERQYCQNLWGYFGIYDNKGWFRSQGL